MQPLMIPRRVEELFFYINGELEDDYPEGGDAFDFLMLCIKESDRQYLINFWSEALSRQFAPGELYGAWRLYEMGFIVRPESGLRLYLERMLARLKEGVTPGVKLKNG